MQKKQLQDMSKNASDELREVKIELKRCKEDNERLAFDVPSRAYRTPVSLPDKNFASNMTGLRTQLSELQEVYDSSLNFEENFERQLREFQLRLHTQNLL